MSHLAFAVPTVNTTCKSQVDLFYCEALTLQPRWTDSLRICKVHLSTRYVCSSTIINSGRCDNQQIRVNTRSNASKRLLS